MGQGLGGGRGLCGFERVFAWGALLGGPIRVMGGGWNVANRVWNRGVCYPFPLVLEEPLWLWNNRRPVWVRLFG